MLRNICDIFINRLLVGAPRGNYTQSVRNPLLRLNEPGAAYSCSLPGSCVEIEPDVIEDQEIFLQQLNRHGHVWKKHSWFGGAMSIDRNSGFLTVYVTKFDTDNFQSTISTDYSLSLLRYITDMRTTHHYEYYTESLYIHRYFARDVLQRFNAFDDVKCGNI